MTQQQTAPVSVLTDGTGVSAITLKKLVKDFVADFLLTGASAIAAANIFGIQDAVAAPEVAGFAIGGAAIRAGYRVILRWATT